MRSSVSRGHLQVGLGVAAAVPVDGDETPSSLAVPFQS